MTDDLLHGSSVTRRASIRLRKIIVLTVAMEALSLLWALHLVGLPVQGGDGPDYHQIAINLISGRGFSAAVASPYKPTIHRAPGYPAFLAALYLVSSRSLVAVQLVQFGLLAATAWMMYRLASRLGARRQAEMTALLTVSYLPLVLAALLHGTESLSAFLAVLFMWLVVRLADGPPDRRASAFGIGLVAGITTLVRPDAALLLLVPLAVLWWRPRFKVRLPDLPVMGCLISGFLLCLLPWTVRNYFVSKRLVPISTGGGMSLLISAWEYSGTVGPGMNRRSDWDVVCAELRRRNGAVAKAAGANGASPEAANRMSSNPLAEYAAGNAANEYMVDRICMRDAIRAFRGIGVLRILLGIPRRLAFLWSTCDLSPDSYQVGRFHRLVQTQFGVLTLLAICGFYLCRHNIGNCWPLWAIPLYLTALHLVFHVEARYSIPGRPFVLYYAGVALSNLSTLAQHRTRTKTEPRPAGRVPALASDLDSIEIRARARVDAD